MLRREATIEYLLELIKYFKAASLPASVSVKKILSNI